MWVGEEVREDSGVSRAGLEVDGGYVEYMSFMEKRKSNLAFPRTSAAFR